MSLLTIVLKGLNAVGPVIAAQPEFEALFDLAVVTLKPGDQLVAGEAYVDLIAGNDARLQAKLAEAAKRQAS